jgi:hypothetical protein
MLKLARFRDVEEATAETYCLFVHLVKFALVPFAIDKAKLYHNRVLA